MNLRILLVLSVLTVATGARAESDGPSIRESGGLLDRGAHARPQMLSFFIGLPFYRGFYGGFPGGLGVRYYIPILKDGFLPPANDEFGIEFGGDFAVFGWSGGAFFGVSVPVEVLWDFHFFASFDAYFKLGIALAIGFGNYGAIPYAPFGAYAVSALGLRVKITELLSFRAEFGYPWVKVGLGFAF